jgi:hypothetical protein
MFWFDSGSGTSGAARWPSSSLICRLLPCGLASKKLCWIQWVFSPLRRKSHQRLRPKKGGARGVCWLPDRALQQRCFHAIAGLYSQLIGGAGVYLDNHRDGGAR